MPSGGVSAAIATLSFSSMAPAGTSMVHREVRKARLRQGQDVVEGDLVRRVAGPEGDRPARRRIERPGRPFRRRRPLAAGDGDHPGQRAERSQPAPARRLLLRLAIPETFPSRASSPGRPRRPGLPGHARNGPTLSVSDRARPGRGHPWRRRRWPQSAARCCARRRSARSGSASSPGWPTES